jgi:hypothetical protein
LSDAATRTVTKLVLETKELLKGLVIETLGDCVSPGVGVGVSVGTGVIVGVSVAVGEGIIDGVGEFTEYTKPRSPFGVPNPVGPSYPMAALHMTVRQLPLLPLVTSWK